MAAKSGEATKPPKMKLSTYMRILSKASQTFSHPEVEDINPCATKEELGHGIAEECYEKTYFTKTEGEKLMMLVCDSLPTNEKGALIDINSFQKLMRGLNLSQFYLTDRVFKVLDQDRDGTITPSQFIKGLSTLIRGNLDEQALFAFRVYDSPRNGYLTKKDVTLLLSDSFYFKPLIPNLLPDSMRMHNEYNVERIQGLVNLIFPKLDSDGDGKITLKDFRSACAKDPTLVEALGQCLPKDVRCHNAHRAAQGVVSNMSSNLEYLRGTSAMLRRSPLK